MSDDPTKRQLGYLKGLGYDGPAPESKREASFLIDAIKSGKKVTANTLAQYRERERREWVKLVKADFLEGARDDLKMNRQHRREFGEDLWVGQMVRVGRYCHQAKHLNGLLVRLEDAVKRREVLPPYEGCQEETCECTIEAVTAREVPRGTRYVDFPERPAGTAGRPRRAKKSSKAGLYAVAFFALAIVLCSGILCLGGLSSIASPPPPESVDP